MPRLASLSVDVCVWDGETAWLAVWVDVRRFHVSLFFRVLVRWFSLFRVSPGFCAGTWSPLGFVRACQLGRASALTSAWPSALWPAFTWVFFLGGGGLVLCWGTVLPRPAAGGVDQPSVFVVFGHYECRGLTAFGRPHWVTGF